jgi:L-asparagine transporter-like permease
MPEGHLSKSTFLDYALDIHIAIWIYLFLSTAYQLFKKSKRYQNESSRQASFLMSGAYFGIGFLGIISFILHFQKSSLFIPLSYVITILIMGLFYYSVHNIYKHGRYKRF